MTNEELSNLDVALYALYKLGGAAKKIHTELIAWEAYNFSKERFSWSLPEFRKRGFPDKTAVRYALETGKKLKYLQGRAGKDKSGSESEGWRFTPIGLEWYLKNENRIQKDIGAEKSVSTTIQRHEADRFIKKIQSNKIYKLYKATHEIEGATVYDFTDMLNCSPDASLNIIRQKFSIIKTMALAINNIEIQEFLKKCEVKYQEILGGKEGYL